MKAGKAMAQGTDESRPEFPRPDRPLYTPDEDAQRQVVARIAQAREGKGAPRGRGKKPEGANAYHITPRRGLPMGQHPQVTNETLGAEWGCRRTKAGELARHPEDMDPWQVRQLCEVCGVTRKWLRYGGDNAYGKYESADTVAAMYEHLSNEDMALVCDLLTRLLGADTVRGIKDKQWLQDNSEWLKRNPKKEKAVTDSMRKAFEAAFGPARETMRAALAPAWEQASDAMRPALEPIQAHAQALKDRYTADEWEIMRQTADRLKAQGADIGKMKPDELLAIARGEYVVP